MSILTPPYEVDVERPWSVLHVVANHEKSVAKHLTVRDVEHYLPLYHERSQWTDRRVSLERPLFPGYVFVRITPQTRIPVISIPSVLHLLGTNDSEMVSAEEINRIRKGLATGCVLRPYSNVAVGTRVRIIDGVFAGTTGVVMRFNKQCKVIMKLETTQQHFFVEVDLKNLEILRENVLLKEGGINICK
jgi:transcription antitermination factor NusG